MCFVKYFENFYENRCNSNAPVFSRMQVAFYFCMEWTPLVHVWFLLPTSIENVGKQKRKRVQLIKPKHDDISAHTVTPIGLREEVNIVTKCKFTFATSFKLSALK